MSKLMTAVVSLGLVVPISSSAQDAAEVSSAVRTITPQDVRARISLLAADSMRGRYTPSPQLEEAAAYIGQQFHRFGLIPGGDAGSYLQRYTVEYAQPDAGKARIAVAGGPEWRLGREVMYQFRTGLPAGPVTGPVVVVSGTPGQPADARLQGALVIVVPAVNPSGEPTAGGSATLAALVESHAAAVIAVLPLADSLWAMLSTQQYPPAPQFPWAPALAPLLLTRDATIGPVLARQGLNVAQLRRAADGPFRITPLPALHLTIDLGRRVTRSLSAPNVVGMLEGRDPTLKNEYVVFSAHMDHVGVGRPDARGDSIYNGADDDASGTTAVIELAEAFSQLRPRPKRSLIFLTVSGEERGLWGSNFFTARPPVPIGQMVADLNSDMVGRNWKDTIVAIGRQHSDLGTTLARVNAAHPELGMTAIDDLWPEERFYYRSDHYNFARRGVPILFFFNGVHQDYHRPGDEPAKIDAEKESRIIKLVFYLGLDVANAAQRPKWNPDSYKEIVEGR